MEKETFKCINCSAPIIFEPGTTSLVCPYCGTKNEFNKLDTKIEELDYKTFISNGETNSLKIEVVNVKCSVCGAEISFDPKITSDNCPFCDSPIINSKKITRQIIQPKSLLPFKYTGEQAHIEFKKWIKKLWFAPNTLKKYARRNESFQGIYLPFWTYDCKTYSAYSGRRGDDYYVTETYTTTENGKTVTKNRQVRKTRWASVNGNVNNNFDDVLVCASTSLPEKYVSQLEPWDLNKLVPFQEEYLSGYRSESYQINLSKGFDTAKTIMANDINSTIKRDIGGDHQQITNVNTSYSNITFKHILLPVWISSYRFKKEIYRIMVNARTGEVQGERPWSKIKIALLIIFILIIVGIVLYYYRDSIFYS